MILSHHYPEFGFRYSFFVFAALVALAAPVAAQTLEQRLAPRNPAIVVPAAPTTTPYAAGKAPLEALVAPSAPLPLAEPAKAPLVLPLERQARLPNWPAADKPPVAGADLPHRPSFLAQAVGPKSRVPSPDAHAPLAPRLSAQAPEPPLTRDDDPVQLQARALLLAPRFEPSPYPPVLAFWNLPDPYAHLSAAAFKSPADLDPPQASRLAPDRPLMRLPTPKSP